MALGSLSGVAHNRLGMSSRGRYRESKKVGNFDMSRGQLRSRGVSIETKEVYLRLTSPQLNASKCRSVLYMRLSKVRTARPSVLIMHCADDVWIALLELVVKPLLRDYCRPVSVASVKSQEAHFMALGLAHNFPQFRGSFPMRKIKCDWHVKI
jgi:hypothetical protein